MIVAGLRVHPLRARLAKPAPKFVKELADSMLAQGLREAVVVDEHDQILDGLARATVWQTIKPGETLPTKVWTEGDPASYILATWVREERSPAQRAFAGAALMPELQAEARERQRRVGGAVPQQSADLGDARDAASEKAGVNHRYIDLAVHALGEPDAEQIAAEVEADRLNMPEIERLLKVPHERRAPILAEIGRRVDAEDALPDGKGAGGKSDRWLTPTWIIKAVRAAFDGQIAFDPATEEGNPTEAGAWCYLGGPTSGLHAAWPDRTWCNPPFRGLSRWLVKALEEYEDRGPDGKRIYLLVPTNLDTDAMHALLDQAADMLVLHRRVGFTPVENVLDRGSGKGAHIIVGLGTSVELLRDAGLAGTVLKASRRPQSLTAEQLDALAGLGDIFPPPTEEEEALAATWGEEAADAYERRRGVFAEVREEMPPNQVPAATRIPSMPKRKKSPTPSRKKKT